MRSNSIILMFLILCASVAHADQYICVPDLSVGFGFNKTTKSWERANFKADTTKHVVSESKRDGVAYQVMKIGANYPDCECEKGFNWSSHEKR